MSVIRPGPRPVTTTTGVPTAVSTPYVIHMRPLDLFIQAVFFYLSLVYTISLALRRRTECSPKLVSGPFKIYQETYFRVKPRLKTPHRIWYLIQSFADLRLHVRAGRHFPQHGDRHCYGSELRGSRHAHDENLHWRFRNEESHLRRRRYFFQLVPKLARISPVYLDCEQVFTPVNGSRRPQ